MAAKRKLTPPKRGEIYLVSFDPTVGAEIQKTRPAIVLQNDVANEYSPITIVAAITSQIDTRLYPTEVLIKPPEGGLSKASLVLLNQIRSIDKQRLVKRLGKLNQSTLDQINQAILISLGILHL